MSFRREVHHSASLDRLEKLITERLQPGSNREKIDKRIWDLFGEEWCVMFTDLAGFSRGVANFGIVHFLQTIHEAERLLIPIIEEHDGILLKVEGDSFFILFRNVSKALRAAVEMQRRLVSYNRDKKGEDEVLLCVGLGFGEVLRIGDSDVFGAQVNAASKLGEDIAGAWEILVTQAVRERVGDFPGVDFEQVEIVPEGASAAWRVLWKNEE